ncbi:MAG: hypothetical protein WCK02_06100 [Bacteroidota bacterium]
MGLSIHYSGRFNEKASLPEMIEELKDIAELYKWHYTIYKTKFPCDALGKGNYNNSIYGISFTPPECETISLCFLSNGRMSCPANLQFFGKKENQNEDAFLYLVFAKTQFAGIETHKIIIHLLKYLSNKYLLDFKLVDEGKYWETEDDILLAEKFKQYNQLIDQFSFGLEHFPINKNESIEDYLMRLFKKIREDNNKKRIN